MNELLRQKCEAYTGNLSGISGIPIEIREFDAASTVPVSASCGSCGCSDCGVKLLDWQTAPNRSAPLCQIFRCNAGLTFLVAWIREEELPVGCILAGPLRVADHTAIEDSDPVISQLLQVSENQISQLSGLLETFVQSLQREAPLHRDKGNIRNENLMFSDEMPSRLLPIEQHLRRLIEENDRKHAREYLNHLLGEIYYSNRFDLNEFKARVLELVVVLSRITGPTEDTPYPQSSDLELTYAWLADVMHRFMNNAFAEREARHSETVNKIIQYICNNYQHKLTLDEIAQQVYLSPSYISSLFKLETGKNLISYINHVRVEQSKHLLLSQNISLVDIARMCGFEDQGYFTKVFKRETGQTPNVYRMASSKTAPCLHF